MGLDLGAQDLFPAFKSQLTGKKVGSRVVITSTAADAFGATGNESIGVKKDDPVVFVVDLKCSATKPSRRPRARPWRRRRACRPSR